MRERRWISRSPLPFDEVLVLCDQLAGRGQKTVSQGTELIAYVEDWIVSDPSEISRLSAWPLEDVTLVQIHDNWRGDFYLLAGNYHTVYQRHKGSATYCSISHPWRIDSVLQKHESQSMFWVGFRNLSYSFLRVRLNTKTVVAPGETREDFTRMLWLEEREQAFRSAVEPLGLPITVHLDKLRLTLQSADETKLLLCSWPDAFGPCQFEINSPDPFEYLVPATRLAETHGKDPATVRSYLNGFSDLSLREFQSIAPVYRTAYRASIHCRLEDLPEIHRTVLPEGRVYTSLSEFQIADGPTEGSPVWVIVGVVGEREGFRIEVRLSRAPLPEEKMASWLEGIIGRPVEYAPLPAFP